MQDITKTYQQVQHIIKHNQRERVPNKIKCTKKYQELQSVPKSTKKRYNKLQKKQNNHKYCERSKKYQQVPKRTKHNGKVKKQIFCKI